MALSAADSGRSADLVRGGLEWLTRTQNPDGGWGDTPQSPSNISTTLLAWNAFSLLGEAPAAARAAEYVQQAAGSLEAGNIASAVERAYGNDRTFSAPILAASPSRAGWGRATRRGDGSPPCPSCWPLRRARG